MKVFHYEDVEAKDAEKGTSKLRLFEMEPGGCSPLHSHSWEHEVFILKGEGTVFGAGEERKFKANNVIFIPPNEKHQFKNTGETTLKFLCLIPYVQE